MALLVGRHVHKIDKKGRVSAPKAFRDVFVGQGFVGVYAFKSLKAPAIEACGESFMTRISSSLDDLEMSRISAAPDDDTAFPGIGDDLASVIMENAHALPFDPEGRIVLPADLLDHAGIAGDALFLGLGARVQIWHPATFETRRRQAFQRVRSRGGLPAAEDGPE